MTDKVKKVKAVPTHPKFKEMIKAAIEATGEKSGISRVRISKYILTNYSLDANAQFHSILRRALKAGVAGNTLIQTKGVGASGSFKLAKATKAKKATVKKPIKKKTAAKKPAAKKGAATKKKPAKVAKPKTVKKSKSPKKAVKKPAVKKAKPAVKKTKPAAKKAKSPAKKSKK